MRRLALITVLAAVALAVPGPAGAARPHHGDSVRITAGETWRSPNFAGAEYATLRIRARGEVLPIRWHNHDGQAACRGLHTSRVAALRVDICGARWKVRTYRVKGGARSLLIFYRPWWLS